MNTYFCHLAERLRFNDTDAIESCIKFIEEDTKGAQHGRARALMCRRLKHCTLTSKQRTRLVSCITQQLMCGDFGQQFKDHLRLALFLDLQNTLKAARKCRNDRRDYVCRYAEWILAHEPSPPVVNPNKHS